MPIQLSVSEVLRENLLRSIQSLAWAEKHGFSGLKPLPSHLRKRLYEWQRLMAQWAHDLESEMDLARAVGKMISIKEVAERYSLHRGNALKYLSSCEPPILPLAHQRATAFYSPDLGFTPPPSEFHPSPETPTPLASTPSRTIQVGKNNYNVAP